MTQMLARGFDERMLPGCNGGALGGGGMAGWCGRCARGKTGHRTDTWVSRKKNTLLRATISKFFSNSFSGLGLSAKTLPWIEKVILILNKNNTI